jgi:hypothetical protein
MLHASGAGTRPERLSICERATAVRDRIEGVTLRRSQRLLILAAVIAAYLLVTALQAERQLWHDELYTYYIAKAPSISRLFQEIKLDLNPPLIYLADRVSLRVLGDNSYAARFPTILAFLFGSFCFYAFVSRRLRPVYGLLAMLVFWSTPFEYYATEARPYGLIIGFFGLAMLAWQRAVEPNRSVASIWALAFAVAGMAFSHFFAVIYVVPFCLAELWRWYRSRKFDLAMWASLVLPSLFLVIYKPVVAPLVTRYEKSHFSASAQASPLKIAGFFYRMLEPESLFLLIALCAGLVVVWRLPSRSGENEKTGRLSSLEWILIDGLLLIPVLVNLAVMRSHGVAFPRYSGPALFGVAFLFALLLGKATNFSRIAAAASCCVLFAYSMGASTPAVVKSLLARKDAAPKPPSPIVKVRPDLPLVANSGLTFIELDKYADPSTVARLHYLTNFNYAVQYAQSTIFEGMPYLKHYFPIRAAVEPYDQFVTEHPTFLVLGTITYHEDWLLRRLIDIHAGLLYLGDYYGQQLYQVTMPGS